MWDLERLTNLLPRSLQERVDPYLEALLALTQVRDARVMKSLGPSAVRGLLLTRGAARQRSLAPAAHAASFDWTYDGGDDKLRRLYETAKARQWQASALPWDTSVDPEDPQRPLLPGDFIAFDALESLGVRLTARERLDVNRRLMTWMLSQFLHGEQGALFAAAQVTEAVPQFDAKLFGASQVMDEARHVEVFHRYLTGKLGQLYPINDQLFVIVDALARDGRWDVKFLGMQILVEGLALGAFGTLYKQTREPLLRELLKMVMRDEARHVHYGVLCLRDYIAQLSDSERSEREQWALEVALLMKSRFMAYEVYEECFEGRLRRVDWRKVVEVSSGMRAFRRTMFRRLVPNLREIGLISPRILARYKQAGLGEYFGGTSADQLDEEQLIRELDAPA